VAKLAVEEYLAYYGRVWRLPSVSLRLANVFGPHQRPDGEMGVIAIFLGKLLRGESLTIHGDGGQTRDFVFVDDVVSAHLRAAELLWAGRVGNPPVPLNVGTGRETTIREIADRLCALAGVPARITHGPAKPGEQRRSSLDATRAGTVLGWRATMGLEEGLTRTFHWTRQAMGIGGPQRAAPTPGPPPGDHHSL
jgi:UDP-glucose 4-epimerase